MRPWIRVAFPVLFILLSSASARPSPAPTDAPSTPGALRVEQPDGTLVEMPLKHTRVSVEITGFVARGVIEQVFSNPFDHAVEAVYTFPLGDRAAVDDFELVVGDRTIRGEIRRREEARRVYEEARAAGFRAALLEQERPNIFTQSVANLEPGREVTVRIRTVETLRYEKGIYNLTFPLVVGPRYIPGGKAALAGAATRAVRPTPDVPDADRITPPVLRPGFRSGHDVEIEVRLEAGVPIRDLSSPSHRILTETPARTTALVRLATDDAIPNKDFMLRWNVASDEPAVGLLAHRDGVDGFFALVVQPKAEVGAHEAAPKEIILVLDTSGSMSGVPIESSKRFVKMALKTLGPRDTFNLIRFSGGAETFSPEPLDNDGRSIDEALEWVKHLRGGGGTEMLAGFRAAFARPADPNRMRMVVFVTDGYIGNEHQILGAIGDAVGDARIFTLGIGSSVNHFLLDRMAEVGRGAYVFIRPDGREAEAVDRFRSWVTKPYLTDLEVDWGALPVADPVPDGPRDLFSGQALTIVGRYVGAGEGDVVVRGRLGGRYWEQRQHVVLPEREESGGALGSLWARHRISRLMTVNPGATPDSVRAEVTALALEFRLMSAFTSFVAVDDSEVVNPGGGGETIHQALPIPEGVSFDGVFGPDGPRALREITEEGLDDERRELPEDAVPSSSRPAPGRERHFKTVVGGGVSNVDPLTGLPSSQVDVDPVEEIEVVTASAGVEYGRAQGGYANAPERVIAARAEAPKVSFHDEFVQDLPVQGRSHTKVLTLAPGTGDADGQRDISVSRTWHDDRVVGPIGPGGLNHPAADHLLDTALRVLADLAEDGRLSGSEGRPALAALLAAQTPEGAVAHDVRVHALATWALSESSAALPDDPWLEEASRKATSYLLGLVGHGGWPSRPGGRADPEATRWARLVVRWILEDRAPQVPAPSDEPSAEYDRLRRAIAAARTRETLQASLGRTPFDRLLGALGRRHLTLPF